MSEAQSHSSAGSQGSIRPDDSVSQILPPYFTDNSGYRYDLDIDEDQYTASDTLSSAPSDLLTPTLASNTSDSMNPPSRLAVTRLGTNPSTLPGSGLFTGDISAMHLGVPSSFLPKRKARKGHCWFPSNGTETFDKEKWHWKCARC